MTLNLSYSSTLVEHSTSNRVGEPRKTKSNPFKFVLRNVNVYKQLNYSLNAKQHKDSFLISKKEEVNFVIK